MYTWHRHVDRRERLRGAEVMWTRMYIYICLLSGSPVSRETNFQYAVYVVYYILAIFRDFPNVGLKNYALFISGRRGEIGSVGSPTRSTQ